MTYDLFDSRFDAAVAQAEQAGWEYDNIVVLSHSAGGVASADIAMRKASAFVQMGCHFDSKDRMPWVSRSLSSYPKPVLTLLGARDGYLRYHSAAGELEDLEGICTKVGVSQ
jgi:acetyl esterase/lipase